MSLEDGPLDNTLEIDSNAVAGAPSQVTSLVMLDRMVPSGLIQHYTITNDGSGYAGAPTVGLSGGGCSSCPPVTATVTSGVVTALTTTGVVGGCTLAPTVAFSRGGGTGAAATATIVTGQTDAQVGPIFMFHGFSDSVFTSNSTGFGYSGLTGNDIRLGETPSAGTTPFDATANIQPRLRLPGGVIFETGNGAGATGFTDGEWVHDNAGVIAVQNPGGLAQAGIAVSFERFSPATVSGLSTVDPAPADGDTAYVTDAVTCTFNSAVTGGGSTHRRIHYDGSSSSWKAG